MSTPPASAIPSESTAPKEVWRVGTLHYTSGALVALFAWLLWGDFAWSLKERSVPAVVQLLFKKYEASDLVTGLLIGALPSVVTMVLGPIISYRSDRHRGRLGRRIPYLILTTPIAALAMLGLAFSTDLGQAVQGWGGIASSWSPNTAILVFLGLFWTIFEFATVAANAVFAGLINDVVPAPLLGRFYGLFRALSLIAGMIFNFWLMGKAEAHFMGIFIGMGALYAGGFALMCLKVKEGDYPPPPPVPPHHGRGFLAAVKTYSQECFSNPYYIWIFLAYMFANLAFFPINLFNVYFAKSVGMSMDAYGKNVALTYLISLGLSYPIGYLADRFHPLRAGVACLLAFALVALGGALFANDASTFAVVLVAHGVLNGAFYTATASLGQRLYPRARFAQFASAAALLLALAQVLLAPAMGKLLDVADHNYRYTYFTGFVLTVLAIGSSLMVYRYFMRLGGPRHYVAPE